MNSIAEEILSYYGIAEQNENDDIYHYGVRVYKNGGWQWAKVMVYKNGKWNHAILECNKGGWQTTM